MYSSADSLFDSLWLDLSVTTLKTDDLRLYRSFSVSSGIGSLGSSVLASGGSSTTTRTNSRTSSRSNSPLTPSVPVKPLRVVYKGRDILDLSGNLFRSPWDLRPAVLPARNINMFWKNRSQYHRLSEYGTRETFEENSIHRFPTHSSSTPICPSTKCLSSFNRPSGRDRSSCVRRKRARASSLESGGGPNYPL
uniref:Uncharacterized protein n=1 Tax=Timema bartmani TaxID=61472 RepID=A0A7R9F9L2_9NEOP|nr:unnamed protein product [Timema bartmani]